MTAFALPIRSLFSPAAKSVSRNDPPKPRRAPPVFIHDAITPCQGETLLSLMLKRDIAAACDALDTDR